MARMIKWAPILFPLLAMTPLAQAQTLPAPACDVMIYEELSELADARIAVDLAKSDFAAYERIFDMIKKLRDAQTIAEMDYAKAKYDRDAAKLILERADLLLAKQSAHVEQYQWICKAQGSNDQNRERMNAIRAAYLRYRRTDCGAVAKGIDIAANNLEYNNEYLKKIVKLRQENFATHTQIILAELDVEREQKSLEDANKRTATCRAALAELEKGGK